MYLSQMQWNLFFNGHLMGRNVRWQNRGDCRKEQQM